MNREEMLKRLEAGEDALELSIEKWQDIVDEKGTNLGERNCALCQIVDQCPDCIVVKETGEDDCGGTSYDDYCHATTTKNRKKYALQIIEFLKSLRKKEEST